MARPSRDDVRRLVLLAADAVEEGCYQIGIYRDGLGVTTPSVFGRFGSEERRKALENQVIVVKWWSGGERGVPLTEHIEFAGTAAEVRRTWPGGLP